MSISYFLLYALLLIVFQIVFSVLIMAVAALKGLRDEELITQFANNNILISNGLSFLFITLILIFIFKRQKIDIKKEFKLHKCNKKQLLLSIITSVSYSILFFILTYDNNFKNSEAIHNSVKYYSKLSTGLGIVLMIINLLILAPISEELSFRGIIYTRAEQDSSSILPIIVSSLLFGIMHLSVGGISLVSGAFFIGFIFSLIYYKTKSLYACIIAHSFANLPDFIFYNYPTLSPMLTMFLITLSSITLATSLCLLL